MITFAYSHKIQKKIDDFLTSYIILITFNAAITISLAWSSPSRYPSNFSKSVLLNSIFGLRCKRTKQFLVTYSNIFINYSSICIINYCNNTNSTSYNAAYSGIEGTYLESIGGTLVQRLNIVGLLLLRLRGLSGSGESLRLGGRAGQDGGGGRRRRRRRRSVGRRRRRRDAGRGDADGGALTLRCHCAPISVGKGIYLCVVVVVVGFAGAVRSRANSLTRRRPPHPSRPRGLAVTAASTAADNQAAARNARHIAVHGVAGDRDDSVESSSNPFPPRTSLRFLRVVVSRPTSTNQRGGIRRGAAPLYSCLLSPS